jgi:hypothetical protein
MTILFYPEPLKQSPASRISRICKEKGIAFHNDPRQPHDVHIFWSYTPKSIEPDSITLDSPKVINRGCWNVSKEKVNSIFNDFSIDPELHEGWCVEKADLQGRHDLHRIVKCPTRKREGFIYQRYIEDKRGALYIKYRIYYAGGIGHILKQGKRSIFGSPNWRTDYVWHEWVDKYTIFPGKAELELNAKCKQFGFDYGDIDFLMEDGKPVIIDINNVVSAISFTPWIKKIQDEQFIKFIHDWSGKVLK